MVPGRFAVIGPPDREHLGGKLPVPLGEPAVPGLWVTVGGLEVVAVEVAGLPVLPGLSGDEVEQSGSAGFRGGEQAGQGSLVKPVHHAAGLGGEAGGEHARVEGHGVEAPVVEAGVELLGEDDVGQLGVAVGPVGGVGTPGVQIVEVDVAEDSGGDAGGVDDGCSAGQEGFDEQVRQEVGAR